MVMALPTPSVLGRTRHGGVSSSPALRAVTVGVLGILVTQRNATNTNILKCSNRHFYGVGAAAHCADLPENSCAAM